MPLALPSSLPWPKSQISHPHPPGLSSEWSPSSAGKTPSCGPVHQGNLASSHGVPVAQDPMASLPYRSGSWKENSALSICVTHVEHTGGRWLLNECWLTGAWDKTAGKDLTDKDDITSGHETPLQWRMWSRWHTRTMEQGMSQPYLSGSGSLESGLHMVFAFKLI